MKQKKNKEFGNKKHIVTRIIVGSLLVVAAGAIGVGCFFAFSAGIYINLAELALLIAVGSLIGGVAMGLRGIKEAISIKINKDSSIKNLNKIADADKNKGKYTKEQRVKIARKYAKANLRLCKIKGCPIVGKFKTQSDFERDKDVEAFNDRENYKILRDSSKSKHEYNKYDNKIKKIDKKLSLPVENIKNDQYSVWTRHYDDFIDNTTIYDRRTEIKCHQQSTKDRFKVLAKSMPEPKKDDFGGFVKVAFRGDTDPSSKPTFARVSNASYLQEVRNYLIQDAIDYCSERPDKAIFPVVIDYAVYDKNASYEQKNETYFSLDELINAKNNGRSI